MAEGEKSVSSPSGGKKHRSPGYPGTDLETALGWVGKVYEAEKMHPTPSKVIAKHIGYSSLSGAAKVALATMKRFGLLSSGSEGARVTEEARKVLLTPDVTERRELLRRLALKPPIIAELSAEYGGRLPSDDTLQYRLVTQRNFSEDGARTLVRVLRKTFQYAQIDGDSTALGSEPIEDIDESEAVASHPPEPVHAGAESAQSGGRPVKVSSRGPENAATFELSDGNWIEIHSSKRLNADTIDELKDYLSVYEKVLKKQARRGASEGMGKDDEMD